MNKEDNKETACFNKAMGLRMVCSTSIDVKPCSNRKVRRRVSSAGISGIEFGAISPRSLLLLLLLLSLLLFTARRSSLEAAYPHATTCRYNDRHSCSGTSVLLLLLLLLLLFLLAAAKEDEDGDEDEEGEHNALPLRHPSIAVASLTTRSR
jgi:hypothetical protein